MKNKKSSYSFVRYSSIAVQMLVIIALFTFLGYKLDQWLEMSLPIFTLILSLSGVGIGIYTAIKDFLRK